MIWVRMSCGRGRGWGRLYRLDNIMGIWDIGEWLHIIGRQVGITDDVYDIHHMRVTFVSRDRMSQSE